MIGTDSLFMATTIVVINPLQGDALYLGGVFEIELQIVVIMFLRWCHEKIYFSSFSTRGIVGGVS